MANLKSTSILLLILTVILIIGSLALGINLKEKRDEKQRVLLDRYNDLQSRTATLEATPKTVTFEKNVSEQDIDRIKNDIRNEFMNYQAVADCVTIYNNDSVVLNCNPIK